MSATVSFVTPRGNGNGLGTGIARVRLMEVVSVPGTTSATAQAGEFIIIGNSEANMVTAAFGTTPDAAATAETAATSAGMPIAAGMLSYPMLMPNGGEKINIKAAT